MYRWIRSAPLKTPFFWHPACEPLSKLDISCVSTKNVKKTRRVRSVSVRKIWVVRKEHFGVTACGSCYRLLHFSQLTHIVIVEVGWDPELPGTLFLTCFSKLFRTSACKDFKCESCKSWYFLRMPKKRMLKSWYVIMRRASCVSGFGIGFKEKLVFFVAFCKDTE